MSNQELPRKHKCLHGKRYLYYILERHGYIQLQLRVFGGQNEMKAEENLESLGQTLHMKLFLIAYLQLVCSYLLLDVRYSIE